MSKLLDALNKNSKKENKTSIEQIHELPAIETILQNKKQKSTNLLENIECNTKPIPNNNLSSIVGNKTDG